MGQCIQAELEVTRYHPLLGQLKERSSEIEVSIPTGGEEEYISWSKRINKLKYSREGRQLLYLPLRETYSTSSNDLFCDNTQVVIVTFRAYVDTLSDNLAKNIKQGRYYREAELWYLLDTLAKYVVIFEKGETTTTLAFHSVVIAENGGLRVIPEIVIPSRETQANLYLKSELVTEDEPKWSPGKKTPIQIIGAMVFALACLIRPEILYNSITRTWLNFSFQKVEKQLSICNARYSPLLGQTLREMMTPNPKQRMSMANLLNRLEQFENQLNAESANRISFGSSSSTEREAHYADLASLKNSHINTLSDAVEENSEQLYESSAMRKQEVSVNGDFPSIL